MILPSKHLSQERALLAVGATLLRHISTPITVSALWQSISIADSTLQLRAKPRYDSFVLALDLLFMVGAIEIRDGLLHPSRTASPEGNDR